MDRPLNLKDCGWAQAFSYDDNGDYFQFFSDYYNLQNIERYDEICWKVADNGMSIIGIKQGKQTILVMDNEVYKISGTLKHKQDLLSLIEEDYMNFLRNQTWAAETVESEEE